MTLDNIQQIACVGGGVIGSSWAIQFAMKGLSTTLYDINQEQLDKSESQMHKSLDALEQYQAITPQQRRELTERITLTTSIEEAVKNAQFIQESGPERLEIKQSILAQVEQYAAPDAVYASSTSGLLITDIAAKASHPERCVGAHPYNPPHLIPLVELTSGKTTSPEILTLVYAFYQSIGKEAVLLRRECPGFIANRLQLALYREVQDLVMRGVCSVEDADKALVYGPGLRWAIFGHNMIMQLGNPGGLTGMVQMLGSSGDRWLEDMASWTHQPDNWAEVAQPGVDQEMAHFPDHVGHTNAPPIGTGCSLSCSSSTGSCKRCDPWTCKPFPAAAGCACALHCSSASAPGSGTPGAYCKTPSSPGSAGLTPALPWPIPLRWSAPPWPH